MFILATVLSFVSGLQDRRDEKGATAVEYALLVGLVSIVIVGAIAALGPKVKTFIDAIAF